ncbi:hypothetical protein EVAR_80283_1 [Eumeta japonica]|uniref:PiggyBac transposable element-derived protein domain-containing protein n=1 Tax=Eumeta variegata TaxID=151549 RepID=A0A4C1UCK4_EUMVA|nr:hypothetical protein EVAR_80283_1 [Eumeta japonica]
MKDKTKPSIMFGFDEKVLIFYVPNKQQEKVVLLLSTLYDDNKIDETTDAAQKPEIMTYYNGTKEVDVQVINKSIKMIDDHIATLLLEENDSSSDSDMFPDTSEDEPDHISEAFEVHSDTDVEDIDLNVEATVEDTTSMSQHFILEKMEE